jgi:hypothetical protein
MTEISVTLRDNSWLQAPRRWAPIVAFGLLLQVSSAVAQQAVIDHCRKTSSDADRIACLEAALLGRDDGAAKPGPAARIDPPSQSLDARPADTTVDEPAPTPAGIDKEVSSPTSAAPSSPSAQRAAPAEPAAEPEGLGAEQVVIRNQSRDGVRRQVQAVRGLRVASYDKVPYERLVVKLENGQVWRQIKGDTQRIRVDLKRNQTVDISEGSVSGYKLRLNEIRRTIRVERIR